MIWPKSCASLLLPLPGLHQHGNTGLVFNNQVQHHLVEVRALLPTVAAGDVNDMLPRLLITVIAAIDIEARLLSRWVNVAVRPKRLAAVAAMRL